MIRAGRLGRKRVKLTFRMWLLHSLPHSRLGDWLFGALLFRRWHGRWPKRRGGTINDVLFRLKNSAEILRPLRVYVTDKEQLKLHVRARLGEAFNVLTMAILRSPAEAEAFDFPARCVIKPTHMSGAIILRVAGEPVDRELITSWFSENFYDYSRERNYRRLTPKVMVEPFVFDQNWPDAFRVFCREGRARLLHANIDRPGSLTRSFFDRDWNPLPIFSNDRQAGDFPRPGNLALMLHVAETLARDFDFIRVDLYSDGKAVKVGELTNCPFSAMFPFASRASEELATKMLYG
jgi:TupA-like ATPgrasp